ncbi:MAG: tetratricopeptide repeat protein [Spirochaetia bacterium]|jgi:tetratricopeptide (TPR) repeat protein
MNEKLERAVKLYHAHRYEQALADLRALEAEEGGGGPEIDYYIGLTLTQLGVYEEALLSLEKVVNSHFSFLHIMQARMVLGYIYSVTGRFRLAEFEFVKVNEMGLQSSQALAALGYVLYAQKKIPEAIDTLKKALDLEPKNPNALNSLGYIYAEEKMDAAKAVTLCRQAVDLAPRNAAYLDSLGWAYFRQGNLLEARANFRRALDLAPGNKDIAAHVRLCMDALKDVKTP